MERGFAYGWIRVLAVAATLRSRSGGGWTTATTATATTLTCRTGSSSTGRRAFLRLACRCFGPIYTLVFAFEIIVLVEVFSTVENDGGFVLGLGALGWRGTLGAFGTRAAITITTAALATIGTLTPV